MGLRFCNEIVISAEQIYPSAMEEACKSTKPLVNHQGFLAVPFVMDLGRTEEEEEQDGNA